LRYRTGMKTRKMEMTSQTGQIEFEFIAGDRPCRTCRYWSREYGTRADRPNGKEHWYFGCAMGQYPLTQWTSKFPEQCVPFKWGGEKMGFVDFKKMSEEQLRAELDRIRSERSGSGVKKRRASREGRVKSENTKKSREAEANAEWC
jgi:hypothetical protein